MHERAIKIRKMTDEQICAFIDSTYGSGMEDGMKLADGPEIARKNMENGARLFLKFLEARAGSGNHIGRGIIYYIAKELENAVAEGAFGEES